MNKLIPYDEYPYKDLYLEESLNHTENCCFPPKLVVSGMIDWIDKKDAEFWGGAWEGQYAGCRITDYSLCLDIPTLEMVNQQQIKFSKYNSFNIPLYAFERMFKWRPDCNRHTFIVKTIDGKECSRSELTHIELETFLRNATPEEIAYRETEIQRENKEMEWGKEMPTKEFPVKIYLFGNDDCSYTKTCKSDKEALKILQIIVDNPNSKYIHDNFIFSN